ncbi:cadherin domain-containing protein [Aliivibrio salmonicida]|uniref:cadherin domain-containing protein n=1 Tax=Aliivibrio salmonicida TaxID=40269 RepID=UPI0030ACF65A
MAIKTSTNDKQIIVIDKNGNLKLMTSGETVLPGDVVLEKDSGEVFVNRDDLPKDNNNEIKDILDAIVDGKDPSLVSDSPAAGEESGSSLTTSTEIERVGKSTIAETDFDTSSLEALGLSKTQSLTLLDQYKFYKETGSFDNPINIGNIINQKVGFVVDSNLSDNTISENAAIGDVVNITGLATDPDGDVVSYTLSQDDIDAGLFAIDATTGVVTVIGNLDHDTAPSHSIDIIATSTDGSTSTGSFDITVTDADGTLAGGGDTDNPVGPVTDSNASDNTISENAAIGDVVNISGLATDPDGDAVSYTLSAADIAAGLFAIDATTGVVTVIGNLDHELNDTHSIEIIATSTDGSTSTDSFTINVTDADGTLPGGGDTDNPVGPVTDSNASDNTISENAAIGDVVNITGLATDPDGDMVTYTLSQDDIDAGLFAIDATTGVVTVIGNLDHELNETHSIEIIATSTDGSTSTDSFTINVTDADGTLPGGGDTDNPVGPVTDSNASDNTISENAAIGDVVNITGLATDPDGDTVTYTLSQDDIDAGLFAIDATTGVVTVIGNLDHETAPSHSIEIIATSTDGSTSTDSFTINVTDADGTLPGGGDTDNPVGPVTDSNASDNTISENAAIGDVVNITGLATDPDGDTVTYTLSQDDIDAGLFAIDATTGVVTVIGNLDHETAPSHSIEIIATSTDGSTSTDSFTINVTDADGTLPGGGDTDNPVGPVTDSNDSDNTISENAAIGDVVNIIGLATDPDGDAVSYSLSAADIAAGLFAIDATTGVVTVIGNLDHELNDTHSIEIIATSTDGSTNTGSFDITVTDADGTLPGGGDTDNPVGPVTDSNASDNTISENAEIGDVVNITGLATDPDGDAVSYSLSAADIAAGLFAIDATTGVVTVIGNLDHDTAPSHSIDIIATSTDGSTSTGSFTINVTDADGTQPGGGDTDNPVGPVTDSNASDNTISENAAIGDVVNITGLATDPDGDTVTYTLSQDDIDAGLFAIDATTGVVTVIGNLDHDTAPSHSIDIIATSTDGSTSTGSFTINVTDADGTQPGGGDTDNPVGPVTDSNASDNTISENAAIGDVVNITGLATDPDGDVVTYTLSQDDIDAGLFAIDATTGVVTVIGNLDHDTTPSHSIDIIATSTDGSTSTDSFTINVTDAEGTLPGGGDTDNPVGPVTDSNASDNTISENAAIGDVVNITGLATDPDGDAVSYTLSPADIAADLFAIDATTGVVTVIGNLDHELNETHSIEIIATSTDGSTSTDSFTINVTDADGTLPGGGDTDNPVGPVTDSNASDNTISENAAIGDVVNIIGLATDPDGDAVSYSLSPADIAAGLFAIDATTGVVTVIGNLDFETEEQHQIEIIAISTDGSMSTETFTINVSDFDEIAPDAPIITNITDDSIASDYSKVTMNGTGEPGASIMLFDDSGVQLNTTQILVSNDGSWSFDISNVSGIDHNENEIFTVKQMDAAGNISDPSEVVHYYHGDLVTPITESSDDYVLLGSGDDYLTVGSDDNNDYLVSDGGAGTDTAILNFALATANIMLNDDGSITITEMNGDVNTFIEFEEFEFTDGNKSADELFSPEVTIARDEDDIINSDREQITYEIKLPAGAVIGAILSIIVEGNLIETITLDQSHLDSGVINRDLNIVDVTDGSLDVSAEIVYPNQPQGSEFKDTDALDINIDPIATDFELNLINDSSIQFSFEPHVSDTEDDVNQNDGKATTIEIMDLPELGSLYLVDGNTRTEITESTVLTEDSQIEYVLNSTINDDLSFNATDDFAPNYNNGTVTSFTLASGVIVSGGTYSGTRPDTTSTLTADELYYDSATNETGLGVGNSEIDVNSKDYIEVDFTDVGNANTTDVDIREVNIDFGSVFGNYSENSNANAEIHILLFKDGVLVGESPYIFDDETHNVYDGSGEFTANLQLDSGFDQIRVYTVHGEGSTASNSNVTLQGVEVVDAMVSESIPYEVTDSDKGIDSGVITVSTESTDRAMNNAPVVDDIFFRSEGTEDTVIQLNLNDLLISDSDGDDVTLLNITVDPASGSLELLFDGDEVVGATFTPAENKHFDSNAPVEFQVTVTDGYEESTGTAKLIVNAVADEPILSVVFGESTISGPGFDTSNIESIKDFFANGGTLPDIGNVIYNGQIVVGDDGNNLIIGSGGVNNLVGDSVQGTGNDVFVGGVYNDSIYGGTGPLDFGIDAVIYSGNIDEYLITNQGGAHGGGVDHWVITDTLGRDTGYDHTAPEDNGDQLYQIERLVFADAIVELNPDGSYIIIQETETSLDLSASVTDIDGSEYLDEIKISGLPDGAQIIDKNSNEPLGEFKTINGEQVWVIDITGQSTQTINYDNLVVRYPSTETLDIDVSAVAKESSNNSEATTTVNASPSQDIYADQGGETPTTLISLVLDSSGSMDHKPFKSDNSNPDQDKTRMELVLEASIAMLDNVKVQEGSEEVKVQLVDFDDQKHSSQDKDVESLGWFTVQSAIDALNAALVDIAEKDKDEHFYPKGGTDYEEGIYAVMSGYQDTQITNITGETNDVVYFLSDGDNNGGWHGGNSGPKDEWEEFIIGKDVTAIGIVRDPNTTLNGLSNISSKVIYLTDGQLITELPRLRPTIGQVGTLLTAIIGLDAAAVVIDVDKIDILQQIDQNGNVSNSHLIASEDNNQLVIDTEYGDLRIAQDGSYYFQPSASAPEIETGKSIGFEILYTVEDDAGAESEQLVTLNVSPNGEVNAVVTSSFNGSTGDDVIVGTENDDIILGHEGDDVLIGGLGDDILTGGAGEDIFKWIDQGVSSGTDTIKDFSKGEDLIDLTELLSDDVHQNDLTDLLAHITISEDGDDLALAIKDDIGNDHTIIVEGGVNSFGLEDANFSNQSEILTKLLHDQLFKLDDVP